MKITTGLLTKGLMGLGAVVGVVTGSVFLFKKGEEPAKVSAVSALPPPPPKPTFEENLQKQIPDLVSGDSKFCNDIDGKKYTCDARTKGTELKEKLKFIKGGVEGEFEIKNITGQKIEIRENDDTNNFPFGIMLVLENGGSPITLQKKNGTKEEVTFKQKTFPEFKFENGKFKHAWTIENLGEKVGLDCKENEGQKTCTLKSGAKINVWETGDNTDKKVEDVTFTGELKWEEDQAEHNQGFKLTPTSDITLKKEGESSLPISSLSSSTSYDIKLIVASNVTNKWYLRKYHTSNR